MINGISPDFNAIAQKCEDKRPPRKRMTDPLSFMLCAALFENNSPDLCLLRDILPYVSAHDRCVIEDILDCSEMRKKPDKCECSCPPKSCACLSPNGNLSGLICTLKRYASPQGAIFLNQMSRALDTARIVGALSDNPDPAELFKFMGLGDVGPLMSMLPQIMNMFGKK